MASFVGVVAQLERVSDLERAVSQLERAAELERERAERAAMHAAGLESRMAERMFLWDPRLLLPSGPPETYEHMFNLRHDALLESHASMSTVLRHLEGGQLEAAMAEARAVVGSDSDDDGVLDEDGEEEAAEDDMEVDDLLPAGVSSRLPAPVRAAVTSALTDNPFAAQSALTAPQAFSGRSFRLA